MATPAAKPTVFDTLKLDNNPTLGRFSDFVEKGGGGFLEVTSKNLVLNAENKRFRFSLLVDRKPPFDYAKSLTLTDIKTKDKFMFPLLERFLLQELGEYVGMERMERGDSVYLEFSIPYRLHAQTRYHRGLGYGKVGYYGIIGATVKRL